MYVLNVTDIIFHTIAGLPATRPVEIFAYNSVGSIKMLFVCSNVAQVMKNVYIETFTYCITSL